MTAKPLYETATLTADVVLVAAEPTGDEILLIRRSEDSSAEPGKWALPGGRLDPGETAERAAVRELAEETTVVVAEDALRQVGVYHAPGRDPRGRVVSFAYRADLASRVQARGQDDAAEARWFPVAELDGVKLAFDHGDIIRDALNA